MPSYPPSLYNNHTATITTIISQAIIKFSVVSGIPKTNSGSLTTADNVPKIILENVFPTDTIPNKTIDPNPDFGSSELKTPYFSSAASVLASILIINDSRLSLNLCSFLNGSPASYFS